MKNQKNILLIVISLSKDPHNQIEVTEEKLMWYSITSKCNIYSQISNYCPKRLKNKNNFGPIIIIVNYVGVRWVSV